MAFIRSEAEQLYWWAAPTHSQAMDGYLECKSRWPPEVVAKTLENEKVIGLVNGAVWAFVSVENYENLRGPNLRGLIVDEAARVREEAWTSVLRQMLSVTGGWAVFSSTPRGRNWFRREWIDGGSGGTTTATPGKESFLFTSHENPHMPPGELDSLKESLPERIYRQEILAEFLADTGGVFRNVREMATFDASGWAPGQPWQLGPVVPGARYMMGVDLAKSEDFTVLHVRDARNRMVYWDRFNKIDWTVQKARIVDACMKWNVAETVVDSTGVGDPIFEDLYRSGIPVRGINLTNQSKNAVVDNFSMICDRKAATFAKIPVFVEELEEYEYQISGRTVRTNAPSGKHDDCVVAACLAHAFPLPLETTPVETLPAQSATPEPYQEARAAADSPFAGLEEGDPNAPFK